MERITGASVDPNANGAGKAGFSEASPGSGAPTVLTPDWCNSVQEELVNVIEGAGLTLDGDDKGQMLAAVNALAGALADAAQAAARVPAGVLASHAADTPPTGWLECNGAAVSRDAYADLYAVLGDTWGAGDGSTTFNLPDLRGEFLRGWDNGAGIDAGRVFASAQTDAFKSHTHGGVPLSGADSDRGTSSSTFSIDATGNTASVGGPETRPRNIAVMFIIKT